MRDAYGNFMQKGLFATRRLCDQRLEDILGCFSAFGQHPWNIFGHFSNRPQLTPISQIWIDPMSCMCMQAEYLNLISNTVQVQVWFHVHEMYIMVLTKPSTAGCDDTNRTGFHVGAPNIPMYVWICQLGLRRNRSRRRGWSKQLSRPINQYNFYRSDNAFKWLET